MSFSIRHINRDEMPKIINLAKSYGWNPGTMDADSFYEADSNGFFVAEMNSEIIGSISAVRYGFDYGFIGFFLVKKEFSGRGLGTLLALRAKEYLKGRIVGAEGFKDRLENYRRLGFRFSHPDTRYLYIKPNELDFFSCPKIQDYQDSYFKMINNYDRKCFPSERDAFLKNWLKAPNAKSKFILDGECIRGFATIRKCEDGYKIGPLFADGFMQADNLFLSLAHSLNPGDKVYIDSPENNPYLKLLANKYLWKKTFQTARLYSGEIDNVDSSKIFAHTSIEIG
jgi:GNAT superfamily N-acetyltransferase